MSDVAILNGAREWLVTNFTEWENDNCKPMPDGQPDPVAKNDFAAVHITESQARQSDDGIMEEVWGFGVTVTKRIEAIPYDKITDSIYLIHLTGLAPTMDRIKYSMQSSWKLTNLINSKIVTTDDQLNTFVSSQKFVEPARLVNRNPKMFFETENWWHGTHGKPERNPQDGFVGVRMTLNFGNLIKQTKFVPEVCP